MRIVILNLACYISPERGGGCELCEQTEGLCKHMKLWEEKRGSPRGELAPARATERGLQFIGLHLNLD